MLQGVYGRNLEQVEGPGVPRQRAPVDLLQELKRGVEDAGRPGVELPDVKVSRVGSGNLGCNGLVIVSRVAVERSLLQRGSNLSLQTLSYH